MFEDVRQAALDVASGAFETMFFILPFNDTQEDRHLPFSLPILQGEIGFRGKYTGKMRLCVPSELARIMAVNFMGLEDEDVPESQMFDVVSEACNVICGNLFSHLDKKVAHVLAIPETRMISLEEAGDSPESPGIDLNFNASGHRVRLDLRFDKDPERNGACCDGTED